MDLHVKYLKQIFTHCGDFDFYRSHFKVYLYNYNGLDRFLLAKQFLFLMNLWDTCQVWFWVFVFQSETLEKCLFLIVDIEGSWWNMLRRYITRNHIVMFRDFINLINDSVSLMHCHFNVGLITHIKFLREIQCVSWCCFTCLLFMGHVFRCHIISFIRRGSYTH